MSLKVASLSHFFLSPYRAAVVASRAGWTMGGDGVPVSPHSCTVAAGVVSAVAVGPLSRVKPSEQTSRVSLVLWAKDGRGECVCDFSWTCFVCKSLRAGMRSVLPGRVR